MSDDTKKPADFDGWRARDAYDMGYRHGTCGYVAAGRHLSIEAL